MNNFSPSEEAPFNSAPLRRPSRFKALAGAMFAFFFSPAILAAEYVESSATVGAGMVQMDSRMAYEREPGSEAPTVTTPLLIVLGLGDAWDVRVEGDGWMKQKTADESGRKSKLEGFGDLSFGVKYHIPRSGPGNASMGVLFSLDMPTGSRAFRSTADRPSVRYIAEWDLPNGCTLGLMPGIASAEDDMGRRYASGMVGLMLGHGWTRRVRGFVEVAAEELGAADHADATVSFDTGVAFAVAESVELDASVYTGLNAATPEWTLAFGLTSRW